MARQPTKAQLAQKLKDMQAQLAASYAAMDKAVQKANDDKFMGSGVIITLTAIGGAQIGVPVMIHDGLSDATIAAIRADIARSVALSNLVNKV